MNKPRPVLGQTLYALNINNNARSQPQELRPVQVLSVGRKYFKAVPVEYIDRPGMAIEYELNGWRERTQYTPNWRLYASEKEWHDERDGEAMMQDIRRALTGFGVSRFPVDVIRQVHALLFPA